MVKPTDFVIDVTAPVKRLEGIAGRAVDPRKVWDIVADDFADRQKAVFAGQRRKWRPLSPRYARWKARHFPGRPLMVATGELRKSLTSRPFGVEKLTRDGMTIGTDKWTARVGGRNPVAEITQADQHRWAQRVQRYLVYGDGKVTK